MTYIVDTHVFVWFLDKNKRLKPLYHQILMDVYNSFVFSTIVLAEIKHLISRKRISVDFEQVIEYLSESENCVIYPIDEDVVDEMPVGLNFRWQAIKMYKDKKDAVLKLIQLVLEREKK